MIVPPPGRPELTDRQAEVLASIVAHMAERGMPPTIREIMDRFGMRSPNGVMAHLRALEKKGYLSHGGTGTSRSIRLAGMRPCPHCGGLGQIPAE